VLTAVRVSLSIGIERAFLLGTALMALGLLTTFFLPEIPYAGRSRTTLPADRRHPIRVD